MKGLGPRVVIMVEQVMNTNTAPLMARVTEACSYYGALFDSFEATMSRDNSERVKIEVGLSRKLANSIACEGRDRVERCEVFGKWRARMGMAGFELKPLSQNVSETLKAKLSAVNRVNTGSRLQIKTVAFALVGWAGPSQSHLLGVNFIFFSFRSLQSPSRLLTLMGFNIWSQWGLLFLKNPRHQNKQ